MVTPAGELPAGELAWLLRGPTATIRMSVTTVDNARLRNRADRYIRLSSRTTSGHINVAPSHCRRATAVSSVHSGPATRSMRAALPARRLRHLLSGTTRDSQGLHDRQTGL